MPGNHPDSRDEFRSFFGGFILKLKGLVKLKISTEYEGNKCLC